MLMDLDTLTWDEDIASDMGIPLSMLPEIRSSSEVYGKGREGGMVPGVPIAGILGDQQAATFGQACFEVGMAKNTYGTGNFMLSTRARSRSRRRTACSPRSATRSATSRPSTRSRARSPSRGSLVQWLRDNLGIISSAPEIEELAKTVDDNGGAYFVPAFSGLFAPYWRSDARGALVGLTRYVNKGHIARAALEATAFQTREVLDAMNADSGVDLTELKVDGGMVANELLMQFQADILGVPVVRPKVAETTALGAAYAAGIAVGFWNGEQDVIDNWAEDKRWEPQMDDDERERQYRQLEEGRHQDLRLGRRRRAAEHWRDGRGPGCDEAPRPSSRHSAACTPCAAWVPVCAPAGTSSTGAAAVWEPVLLECGTLDVDVRDDPVEPARQPPGRLARAGSSPPGSSSCGRRGRRTGCRWPARTRSG